MCPENGWNNGSKHKHPFNSPKQRTLRKLERNASANAYITDFFPIVLDSIRDNLKYFIFSNIDELENWRFVI